MWKKKFEGDPPLLPGIHFCYCVCVAEQIINNLYFLHYLFRGRFFFFKGLGSSHSEYKDRMGKINNSFKIPKNKPNIIISHS